MHWLKFWFPVVVYSAIIFGLSRIPGQNIVEPIFYWDKLLHTIEYAGLGLLYARALSQKPDLIVVQVWALSVIFCYIYGVSDEFHQSFTPGRDSSLWDSLADFNGAAIGAGIYLLITQRIRERAVHVSH